VLNFCRLFLPHPTAHQPPLHDVFSGPRVKGSHPITWTLELLKAFEECKASLSCTTLLAHPDSFAPLALITDSSTSALGAVFQQRVKNARQCLIFYPKKTQPRGETNSCTTTFYPAVKATLAEVPPAMPLLPVAQTEHFRHHVRFPTRFNI
jgi:hypothetical protein